MQIVPIRDLKDTVKIEELCSKEKGPVYITKNGRGRLVIMNLDYFEKMKEALLVYQGLEDLKNNSVKDAKETLELIKKNNGF